MMSDFEELKSLAQYYKDTNQKDKYVQALYKMEELDNAQAVAPSYAEGEIPRVDAQGMPVVDYEPSQDSTVQPSGLPQEAAFSGLEIIASLASSVPSSIEYVKEGVQGAIKSLIDDGFTPEQAAQKAAEEASKYAYQPQSEGAQAVLGAIDELTASLPPVAAVSAPQLANIGQGARGARTVSQAVQPEIMDRVDAVMSRPSDAPQGAVGAAQVDMARQRQEAAGQLPIPIDLTKGQATQDLPQQKFERETAKTELGEDLRTRFTDQNEKFNQNLDAMIDETGTQLGEDALIETGQAVTNALSRQIKSEKAKIDAAYRKADESEGAREPVNLESVGDFVNENMASANYSGNVLDAFQKEVNRLGVGEGDFNSGDFRLGDMTVFEAEQLRKFINQNVDSNNPRDVRLGSKLKESLDIAVGDAGGEPYNRARRLRSKFSEKYEDKKLISDLTSKKPGSSDRRVALENVVKRSVNQGSRDDLLNLRRTLQRTDDGKQAYSEIAAQALKDIKSKSTGGVGQDERGNPLVSPAKLRQNINALDKSGKLEVLYGKKGAEDLRTIADVARDVYVSQGGAVNYSNTASSLAMALDLMASPLTYGAAGLPLPIMTALKSAADKTRKMSTRKKVKEALEFDSGANE